VHGLLTPRARWGAGSPPSPLGRSPVVALIFLIVAVKALLGALYYMDLRVERRVIYAMAIVPLVLVAILTFLLLPAFVFHRHWPGARPSPWLTSSPGRPGLGMNSA